VIVQPAPNTALTVLAIAQIFEDAGLLAGSLNVVTHSTLGANLEIYTQHPAVHKLVVSGSKQLEQQALSQSTQANSLKRVSVERFGPAPMLVFDDADVDLAVNAALHNKLLYSGGQSCLRSNRIFVHESIVEPFIAALRTQVESLSVVGMGTTGDGEIDLLGEIAPLLDIAAGQQLESLVNEACQQGARVITGGQRLVSPHHPKVFAYAPTILAGVQDTMAIAHHETTGPVILISSFSSDLELHDRIQCTSAATYLFTENLGRVFEFGDCLNTVLLGVNDASFLGHEVLADNVLEQSQHCTGSNGGLDTYLAPQNMLMRSGSRGGTAA
jgi:succinate-semialdehyde dehydrogenase/glutarate-semialdehyde dehydrogenase